MKLPRKPISNRHSGAAINEEYDELAAIFKVLRQEATPAEHRYETTVVSAMTDTIHRAMMVAPSARNRWSWWQRRIWIPMVAALAVTTASLTTLAAVEGMLPASFNRAVAETVHLAFGKIAPFSPIPSSPSSLRSPIQTTSLVGPPFTTDSKQSGTARSEDTLQGSSHSPPTTLSQQKPPSSRHDSGSTTQTTGAGAAIPEPHNTTSTPTNIGSHALSKTHQAESSTTTTPPITLAIGGNTQGALESQAGSSTNLATTSPVDKEGNPKA
ncbi:MAG: hypothetical protein ACYDHP_03795 [Ferrimicrobium sp.]